MSNPDEEAALHQGSHWVNVHRVILHGGFAGRAPRQHIPFHQDGCGRRWGLIRVHLSNISVAQIHFCL